MTPEQSHQHSLKTLNYLAKLDDYLEGVHNIADMGAGVGYDAAWWASLNNSDGNPYNFKVSAVEIAPNPQKMYSRGDMQWRITDYNTIDLPPQDIIWCHDSFQYSTNPVGTLQHWHKLLRVDGLLLIAMPYKTFINNHLDTSKPDMEYDGGCYYVHTLGSLILQLATAGFDCRNAHFKLDRDEGWMYAGVYRTEREPQFYRNWYDLKDANALPESIDAAIHAGNKFRETELVVEWIDRSVTILSV